MEIKHTFEPTSFPTDEGRYNPAVRHYEGDELKGTLVWEYELYDRRDAEIIADVLAHGERFKYMNTIKNELKRIKNRVSRTR